MHDVVIVGIPLLAILAGIFFNRNDTKELRAEMNTRFNEVNARFNEVNARFNDVNARFNDVNTRFNKVDDHLGRIDADLRQFYHLTGKLEARMDSLEKRG